MFGDEISGWGVQGQYSIAGAYDQRAAQYAAMLNGALASGWDVGAGFQMPGLQRGGMISPLHPAVATPQAAAQTVTALQDQVAKLQNQLGAGYPSFQQMLGAYPTVGPGGAISYPPALQAAAASPVRGGFGATGPVGPVRTDVPKEIRGTPLGFVSDAAIATLTDDVIISRPQEVFRCERLVIPSSVAPNFLILDVKVGNKSQLLNGVGLPAEMFSQDAVGMSLRFDTAQPSQDVSISVQNIDTDPHFFYAGMAGTAAI